MKFDELIHSIYRIGSQSHDDELKEQIYVLSRGVAKEGVSNLVPNKTKEKYPFARLINDLEALAEQARYMIDRIELMWLREELLNEGITEYQH